MDHKGFLKIRTYAGGGYQWEDISDRLIGFSSISESPRSPRTGEIASSSFTITVDNSDGFWFSPEDYNALGVRINKGDDPYGKALRHRRVRVGLYIYQGARVYEQPWATAQIIGMTASVDSLTVNLKCETLEAEAQRTLCDVDTGQDVYDRDYGIRGHVIEYDGDFADDDYTMYRRKELYTDTEDRTAAIEMHESCRVNNVLKHIENCLDIAEEENGVEDVLRSAYQKDTSTDDLIKRKAADTVKVLDNEHFGHANDTEFLLTIADLDGNIFTIYEDQDVGASKSIYYGYYNYHTNTWKKWGSGNPDDQKKYSTEGFCDVPAKTGTRLGWWNSYTQTFQWLAAHSTLNQWYIFEYDPAADTVNSASTGLGTTSNYGLCFAQTTGANSGQGSFFCFTIGAPKAIVEYDVSNVAGGLAVHTTVTDPTTGLFGFIETGQICSWGSAGMTNTFVTAAAAYDTIGTNSTKPARGLVVRIDRASMTALPTYSFPHGQFYGALWIDLYGDLGTTGVGIIIWRDTTLADDMSQTQAIFKVTDPNSVHQTILPLQAVGGGSYTFVRFPDAAWGINNPSATGAVSGSGEDKFAYYDDNGGQGVQVPAEYEDREEGQTTSYTRFYFWANMYYGANGPGKLQSTDGDTLRSENSQVKDERYGDIMFGNYPNAKVATGLTFTRGREGRAIVIGGFYNDESTYDKNYIFVYGWDIQWTLPLLDVRGLSIAKLLSNLAQLTGYEWWFGPRGELNFQDKSDSDALNQVFTLDEIIDLSLDSAGFDYSEIVNHVTVSPYTLTYQDTSFFQDRSVPHYKYTTGNTDLEYIVINPSCDEHVLIRVEISSPIPTIKAKVYEWDDVTDSWSQIGSEFNLKGDGFTDPNGRFSIPQKCWRNEEGTGGVGDFWLVWTLEPLWGLEKLDESRYKYEALDADSQLEYGLSRMDITDNRFITRIDADMVSNRILSIQTKPKKIYSLTLPLLIEDEVPAIGNTVYFEDDYFQIEKTQGWRVIGREKNYGTSDNPKGSITLRVEEIIT